MSKKISIIQRVKVTLSKLGEGGIQDSQVFTITLNILEYKFLDKKLLLVGGVGGLIMAILSQTAPLAPPVLITLRKD